MSNSIIEGRFVVCAACQYGDVIIAGARHYDGVMRSQLMAYPKDHPVRTMKRSLVVQGFIDQYGVFMTREEALVVAKEAGQINVRREKTFPEDELFSEDLY